MISTSQIIAMFFPVIFCILFITGLILYFRKKTGITLKPLLLGAAGFIVFVQILEQIPHSLVVLNFPNYADHPAWFGLYGGLAAGIFEEIGRFILFTWLLKQYRDYKDGISLGIGWGGTEAVLMMGTALITNLSFSFMINNGNFDSLAMTLPDGQAESIREALINSSWGYYLLAAAERFFAVFIQLMLSLIVLYAVWKKRFLFVIYAILIHAAINFPLAFVETGHLNIWLVEGYLAVVGLFSMFVIRMMKKRFAKQRTAAD